MTDHMTYKINKTTISKQKMQFNIINRRPEYLQKEKERVKSEIEHQLFTVFYKYVRP